MTDAGFFKGTSIEQDVRWGDKQKKLMKSMKFPKEFEEKIDMQKVRMEVMQPWIAKRILELLGFEDDVLINFIYGQLEERFPDPKTIQINLTGFLEKNAADFMRELWNLLLSAQNSSTGIPQEFLEKKKQEIAARKMERIQVETMLKTKREQEELERAKEKALEIERRRSRPNSQDSKRNEERKLASSHDEHQGNDQSSRKKSHDPSSHGRQREMSPKNSDRPHRHESPRRESPSRSRRHRSRTPERRRRARSSSSERRDDYRSRSRSSRHRKS